MSAARVLVAFASAHGSTAGIAEAIGAQLRDAGFEVDCRPAASVEDLSPYAAVILGSGVFLARRTCDGGGFIARHAPELYRVPVWLFSAGPIGRPEASTPRSGDDGEAPVVLVAQAIGARGAAAFGSAWAQADADEDRLPDDHWRLIERARSWAAAIAADLSADLSAAARPGAARPERSGPTSPHRRMSVTR